MTMAAPDAGAVRRQLVELIGDSVYHALGLKESLGDEFRALEAQDMDALGAAIENKARSAARLEALEERRKACCADAGFEPGPEQMQRVTEWCDADSALANCWGHLLDIAAECVSLNITNGAIIRSRRQHVESSLAVIRGGSPGAGTYSPAGAVPDSGNQRSLAEA